MSWSVPTGDSATKYGAVPAARMPLMNSALGRYSVTSTTACGLAWAIACVLHVDRVARHAGNGHWLGAAARQRARDALQAGLSEAVVLVEHGDAVDADGGEVLDDLGGLVVVARAQMEDVAMRRRAQGFGAADRADQRQAGHFSNGSTACVGEVP
jgi:hypothetical protein